MSDINMNDLLDRDIDDLADMPEFTVYPAGVHKVLVKFEKKEVNKHPCVELKMTAVETIELANPAEDTPLQPGTEGTVLFMMDNELGQGNFKKFLKPLATMFGTSKINELMEAADGAEITVVTKVRANKEKTQNYTDVVKVIG